MFFHEILLSYVYLDRFSEKIYNETQKFRLFHFLKFRIGSHSIREFHCFFKTKAVIIRFQRKKRVKVTWFWSNIIF